MANRHILRLEVPEVASCEIFRVKDVSEYSSNMDVTCSELLITAPGRNQGKLIEVQPGFDLPLTACNLGLQTTGCGGSSRSNVPDGIYIVRYSVAPNDKVFVEYNVLRTCNLMCSYYKKLCDIDVTPCEPKGKMKDLLLEMKFIRTMIDAAKAKVEYCNSPHEGMELYNFAKRKLEKIVCNISC